MPLLFILIGARQNEHNKDMVLNSLQKLKRNISTKKWYERRKLQDPEWFEIRKENNKKNYKKWIQNNKRESKGLRQRFKVLQRDNFTCQYCGRKAPNVILEVDHVIPKSKGGLNTMSNYVTACKDCNIGKSNSLIK